MTMPGAGRKRDISDDEILLAFAKHPEPVATSKDIAEYVGMTNQGVNKRLKELVEKGMLVEKQAGARAKVYWLDDEGRNRLAEI